MSEAAPSFACAVLALTMAACGDAGRIEEACRSNADCLETQLCATGICEGGLGVCVERPTMCESGGEQACGCDGRTYENACFASLDGTRLAQLGACRCTTNADCPSDQFCELSGSCSNEGTCQPRPDMCEPLDEPVCGCDGESYDNSCLAAQAGTRVSAEGTCDCDDDSDCATNEYCDAQTCDGPGGCLEQPSMCPPDEDPVTGCDGVVYENPCEAAMNGVRLRP